MSSYANACLPGDDLRQMQLERFKIFELQDAENGHFDITFEVEGKKLHANKCILTPFSETMSAMVSNRWSNKDEAVKIEAYSYVNFYQFLRFLYSGSCSLTEESVFQMVDLAEFYGVKLLKQLCDTYLSETKYFYCVDKIEEMHEFAEKYSLKEMRSAVDAYINNNFNSITGAQCFLSYKKPFLQRLSRFYRNDENIFESVYKWAEHQITKQQQPANEDENFYFQEAIKTEVETILPNPAFSSMSFQFLMDFVFEKGYTFSPNAFKNLYYYGQSGFERLLQLAQKQALQRQKKASDSDNFDVSASIKADLAEIIPKFCFYNLDKKFLMDSVVANGILTKEQADHVHDTRVCITNNGKRIFGVFKDEIGLRQAYDQRKGPFNVRRCSTTKIRFPEKHFDIPSTPSTVTKMKGVHWYLCLEIDNVLSFKTYSDVHQSDYLLAEMKSDTEFQLTRNEKTCLSAEYNNLNAVL